MFIKVKQELLGKQQILTFQQVIKHFITNLKNMILLSAGEISTCILIIKSTCVV